METALRREEEEAAGRIGKNARKKRENYDWGNLYYSIPVRSWGMGGITRTEQGTGPLAQRSQRALGLLVLGSFRTSRDC